jgi:hypothetical protein
MLKERRHEKERGGRGGGRIRGSIVNEVVDEMLEVCVLCSCVWAGRGKGMCECVGVCFCLFESVRVCVYEKKKKSKRG